MIVCGQALSSRRRTRFIAFSLMKEVLRGKHYTCGEKVKTAAMKWLKEQSTEFYKAGVHVLIRRLNIAIERYCDYVER